MPNNIIQGGQIVIALQSISISDIPNFEEKINSIHRYVNGVQQVFSPSQDNSNTFTTVVAGELYLINAIIPGDYTAYFALSLTNANVVIVGVNSSNWIN